MDAPRILLPDRMNAAAVLVDSHAAAGRGSRPAIICGDLIHTYAEVLESVDRVGSGLRALGVGPGDRVLILLPDGPRFAAAFFGAMKIGAVSVPASTLLTAEDYRHMLEDSRASVLVVAEDLVPRVAPVIPGLRSLRHAVVAAGSEETWSGRADGGRPAGGGDRAAIPGALDFDAWIGAAGPGLAPADTSKDDPAFWLYSSGTTGLPKAAVHLHHDMIVAADLYARGVLGIGPDDVCLSAAKLFFAFGLGNGLYFPFRAGAAAVHIPGRATPEAVFGAIARHRPTLLFGVPTGYSALLAHAEASDIASLGRVRLAVSAGEPLPRTVFKGWKARFGVEILDGIGSTEVLHIFISNRPGAARPGSTGQVVPGFEARIVDGAGRDLPAGEVGDLLVKGDSSAACYWTPRGETRRTILGEWIRTGDRFHADADGFFWFHGRSDEMLKVSGCWVSPSEVEGAILEHPAVLECAVTGFPGDHGLTRILASAVLRKGVEASRALEVELREHLRGRLAPHKLPDRIEFVPALPRTPSGKLQRFKLRERAGSR